MSSFFKGYNEIWSISNKILNRYEKDILITLIGYWKRATEEFHYQYIQMSYRYIMNAMGESDPHLIQKYVGSLQEKGLLEITNIEKVIKNRHTPRIILKEEKINVFFKAEIFKNTGKRQNQPAGTAQPSTTHSVKKETGEATKEELAAPPGRQATFDYITNLSKTIKKEKIERNGIQEKRRNVNAEELAYVWE